PPRRHVAHETLLASWNDTPSKTAITDFVAAVTTGSGAVAEAERVAVFDNDGTLWTEKPMPTQLHFIVEKWRAQAAADPSLADRQPYKAAVTGDFEWLGATLDKHYAGDDTDLKLLIGAVLSITADRTVDAYAGEVSEFYRTAQHMTLGCAYRHAVYQPM